MARHRDVRNMDLDDMMDYGDYQDDYDYEYDEGGGYFASGGVQVTSGSGKKKKKKKSSGAPQQQSQKDNVDKPHKKDKYVGESKKDTCSEEKEKQMKILETEEKLKTLALENEKGAESQSKNKQLESSTLTTESEPSVTGAARKKKEILEEFAREQAEKPELNLVVVGHVDSGKSTLMGHLLFKMGCVNKKLMRKYEHDSKTIGKGSFAYAWVLDEQGEERERGITVDVAMKSFYTEHRKVTLLDAPGHKDFIPNMIAGAAQADVAILVIDSAKGAFEAGFEHGGQTREHALLVKSLGVSKLIVAVNKMDQWEWELDRFREIEAKIKPFLSQCGYQDKDLVFIPISGTEGGNLVERMVELKHMKGPCLIECIDAIEPPARAVEKPLRFCVYGMNMVGGSIHLSGKIETGYLQTGDNLCVLPAAQTAVVRSVQVREERVQRAMAGTNVQLVVTKIDPTDLSLGSVLCPHQYPVPVAKLIVAKLVVLNTERAITRGYPVELFYQAVCEPAIVSKLISQVHKSSGEVIKQRPKALSKNSSGVVEIEPMRPICVETFQDCKELGRLALRSSGKTVAVGIILEVIVKGDSEESGKKEFSIN